MEFQTEIFYNNKKDMEPIGMTIYKGLDEKYWPKKMELNKQDMLKLYNELQKIFKKKV